ncbi:DUF6894 family protein [Bradyrhizobium arachidis]|uniref:DUF6894 family protein n=1 Tax=Bradyrhizobium arachidis TaxID=858423 RepID=UPI0011603236|nr:hypothetical protein [Bradyrhizobium arachidis]
MNDAMPRFYFHFVGDTPAHDVLGQEFADEAEARARGRALANHLATEQPHLVRDGNSVVVVSEDGREIEKLPLV